MGIWYILLSAVIEVIIVLWVWILVDLLHLLFHYVGNAFNWVLCCHDEYFAEFMPF